MNADLGNSLADFLLAFISVYQRFHFYAVGNTSPRVAIGLQALQRCSGLLNRRARGSTVATHHFADVAQQRQVLAHGHSAARGAHWQHASALSIGPILREEWQIEKIVERSAGNHRSAGPLPSAALLQTFAPVAQLPERDASNVGDVGESPSGSANLRRVSPTTRDASFRTERVLAHGHQGGNPSRGTNLPT